MTKNEIEKYIRQLQSFKSNETSKEIVDRTIDIINYLQSNSKVLKSQLITNIKINKQLEKENKELKDKIIKEHNSVKELCVKKSSLEQDVGYYKHFYERQKKILDIVKHRMTLNDITIDFEKIYKCFNEDQYEVIKGWLNND